MSTLAVAWALKATGLNPTQKLVLIYLADHYNEELGFAFMGQKRLAAFTGLARETVTRTLTALESDRWFVSEEQPRHDSGRAAPKHYFLCFDRSPIMVGEKAVGKPTGHVTQNHHVTQDHMDHVTQDHRNLEPLNEEEKAKAFSSRGQQKSKVARKKEAGVSASENSEDPATPRPLNPYQEFIKYASEQWNELRHPKWPTTDVKEPSRRAMKYLGALYSSEKKDAERAGETVRLGLQWIRSQDEWAKGQVYTFEQMLANEKLESAASKARHHLAAPSVGSSATPPLGGAVSPSSRSVAAVHAGDICSAFGSSRVEVIRDVMGNGHMFLVRHLSTGLMERIAHYDLQTMESAAS